MDKYWQEGLLKLEGGLKAFNEQLFKDYPVIIYIMAMGIVVRDIAPFLRHKSIDPAVLCMTLDGGYIIPVLSGHLGGGNAIAREIGQATGAIPVITTASDLLGKPAVDMMAQSKGLVIGSFPKAKDLTAMLINGNKVQVLTDLDLVGDLGGRVIDHELDQEAEGLIFVGYRQTNNQVPTVHLIPKCLVVGIGARRDTPYDQIKDMLVKVLGEHAIDIRGIKAIASIDLKEDEPGIIALAQGLKVPFVTYSSGDLLPYEALFEGSEFVKQTTGVACVAMPSGYCGSNQGTCIIEKVVEKGVTMCLWEDSNDLYR